MDMKTRHLNVMLLKKGYTVPEKALKNASQLVRYSLKKSLSFTGSFHVQPTRNSVPWWLEFVQNGVTRTIELSDNAANSAVLFVAISSRILAVTFGYGRYLLDQSSFERDFGLKVALNTINPNSLRGIDLHTFEELPIYTRQQAGASSSLEAFNLDVDSDVLRAMTGEAVDDKFAIRVTGSDALGIVARFDFEDIGKKCHQILKASQSRRYKKDFPWIDHLQAIREPRLKDDLDARVVDLLLAGKIGEIHLCPPEPLDWEAVEGFQYSCDRESQSYADLDMESYLKTLQDPLTLTIAAMKRHRIYVSFTGSVETAARWSIYECIVCQLKDGESLYVLTAGRWFRIDTKFAKRIYNDIKEIPTEDNYLLRAKTDETEGQYNERAAKRISGFVLMDKKNIRCDSASTPVEFCDLFTRDKRLIHVKRKTRSATLSHLFGQGTVSAELLLRDDSFRRSVRSTLRKLKPDLSRLVPTSRPRASDYQVVYAIITDGNRKWPDCLPFFSQLYLRQNARRLRDFGYNVLLARITLE